MPTALIVEDEHEVRATIAIMLEYEGFQIFEAADAAEAERLWASSPNIDLLVTDLWMPGMSGFDLAVLFRHKKPDLKVVFVSGLNPRPTKKELGLMADAPLVTKPFERTTLVSAVRKALKIEG